MANSLISRLKNGQIPVDFNWNAEAHPQIPIPKLIPTEPTPEQIQHVQLVSEDLRDGLHGVAEYPSVQNMIDYVDGLYNLGIRRITVGIYPGEENKINASIKKLLEKMYAQHKDVVPVVLSLTTPASLHWLAACKKLNPNLEAIIFMGTAPSRMLVEEWSEEYVLTNLSAAIKEAVNFHNIKVIGATEHTTQTPPAFLKKIITTIVEAGASKFCIADTIGLSRPIGVFRIVTFVKETLAELKAKDVLVEWHGHRDLGNDVANALAAISAGANLIHTVARGIGERAGNTQLEALLLNFNAILEEADQPMPWNMNALTNVLTKYNDITGIALPSHGPLSKRAHTTSLGIHTAAMLKAAKLARQAKYTGEKELSKRLEKMSRRIYSAVDPELIGEKHQIRVGPWSGISTVKMAYMALGGDPNSLSNEAIALVLQTAKKFGRELTVNELRRLLVDNNV